MRENLVTRRNDNVFAQKTAKQLARCASTQTGCRRNRFRPCIVRYAPNNADDERMADSASHTGVRNVILFRKRNLAGILVPVCGVPSDMVQRTRCTKPRRKKLRPPVPVPMHTGVLASVRPAGKAPPWPCKRSHTGSLFRRGRGMVGDRSMPTLTNYIHTGIYSVGHAN